MKSIIGLIFTSILAGVLTIDVRAQQQEASSTIETKQDSIEDLYVEIYEVVEVYPQITYGYVYEDGEVSEVTISGIPRNVERRALELDLLTLAELKEDLYKLTDADGIYYLAETEPKPKQGFEEYYDDLHELLEYPQDAKDEGLEGTIYVKFIVDDEGNVGKVVASERLDAEDWLADEMKQEAIKAVKATSGEWEPASVGGIPVSQWVVLPVQFKLENPYYRPLFGI